MPVLKMEKTFLSFLFKSMFMQARENERLVVTMALFCIWCEDVGTNTKFAELLGLFERKYISHIICFILEICKL